VEQREEDEEADKRAGGAGATWGTFREMHGELQAESQLSGVDELEVLVEECSRRE